MNNTKKVCESVWRSVVLHAVISFFLVSNLLPVLSFPITLLLCYNLKPLHVFSSQHSPCSFCSSVLSFLSLSTAASSFLICHFSQFLLPVSALHISVETCHKASSRYGGSNTRPQCISCLSLLQTRALSEWTLQPSC